MPFAVTWVGLEILILSEVSHTDTAKYHTISLIYETQKRKMIQMNSFTKQKQPNRHKNQTYGYPKGKMREGIN